MPSDEVIGRSGAHSLSPQFNQGLMTGLSVPTSSAMWANQASLNEGDARKSHAASIKKGNKVLSCDSFISLSVTNSPDFDIGLNKHHCFMATSTVAIYQQADLSVAHRFRNETQPYSPTVSHFYQ